MLFLARMETAVEKTLAIKTEETVTPPVVIEFGKKSKKSIRQMGEGRGRLFSEITAAVTDLKSNGTISAGAQPVIVVVKQKPQKRGLFGL
jgi:hypothetical protein